MTERDRLATIVGSFPLHTDDRGDDNQVLHDAFSGDYEARTGAIYQIVDDILAEVSAGLPTVVAWQYRYRMWNTGDWSAWSVPTLDKSDSNDEWEWRALYAPPVAPVAVSVKPFGLSTENIETLRSNGLKPEEIAGDQRVQAQRVGELLHWFVRLARDSANPKWTRSHAFELAYYLATTDDRAPFDIGAVESAAWLKGLQEPAEVRDMAVRHGWIPALSSIIPATKGGEDAPMETDSWRAKAQGWDAISADIEALQVFAQGRALGGDHLIPWAINTIRAQEDTLREALAFILAPAEDLKEGVLSRIRDAFAKGAQR